MVSVSTGKGSSQEYGTPDYIFNYFHDQYQYDVDGAASIKNHKLPVYYSINKSFLDAHPKYLIGKRIWINPPYNNVLPFVEKALGLMAEGAELISFFVNNDPTTKWYKLMWNDSGCLKYFDEIGHRVKFIGAKQAQSYPSICITLMQKHGSFLDRYVQLVDPPRPKKTKLLTTSN